MLFIFRSKNKSTIVYNIIMCKKMLGNRAKHFKISAEVKVKISDYPLYLVYISMSVCQIIKLLNFFQGLKI